MPFWQTFASNGKAQAGTLSGGETSLILKVIPSRWVLGLCSWFTLASPPLNAGISRVFSLEKPSIQRSELIQASSYMAVKNLCSLQIMKLLWNFCRRLCMPPESFQNLSYRDTAAFPLFKERKYWWRKELKQPWAFLQLHLYLPTTPSKVQWEQWPLKMWVAYELSVQKLAKQKKCMTGNMIIGSILPLFHNSSLKRLLNYNIKGWINLHFTWRISLIEEVALFST